MIIGNGDIASVLTDNDDLLYFASGVSNSKETRGSEFRREKQLLFQTASANIDKRIVYFGSLAIFYSDTPYARHKRQMEACVKLFPRYTIVRLGNITWGTNPHTLINYMRQQKLEGKPLDIQDTFRYIIDLEEFLYWVNLIPDWNCEMNLTGHRMTIREIVNQYVHLGSKGA